MAQRGHDHTAVSLATLIEDDRVNFYTRPEAAVKPFLHRFAESFRTQQNEASVMLETLEAVVVDTPA